MAVEKPIPGGDWSFAAGADLSGSQFRFVSFQTDGEIEQSDTAGERPAGVLQNKPRQGSTGTVRILGGSKVVAGAVLSVGTVVMSDADGKAIAHTGNNTPAGIVIVGAAAEDSLATIFVNTSK